MKKIILITTGGTIASTLTENTLGIDKTQQSFQAVIEMVTKNLNCHIEIKSPLNKNSEAFSPSDWLEIITCIKEANQGDISGVIVTHGTDTMAYSLSAVMCYQALWATKICFTGAYYPPEYPESDAGINLLAAIHFVLADKPEKGSYLAFRADDSNTKVNIIDGAHLKPMGFDQQYFESFYDQIITTFTLEGRLITPNNFSGSHFPSLETSKLPTHDALLDAQNKIAFIALYPGIDERLLEAIIQNRTIIIIEMYHCGTGSIDLLGFIKKHAKKVTFLMGTFPKKYINFPYESTSKIQQAGAFIYTNLQPYCLYVFALLALSLNHSQDDITQQLWPWELKHNVDKTITL